MDVKGYLVGGFPRPANLIKSFREHVKGKKTLYELEAEIQETVREVVRLQKDNGLYYVFDGQLTWDDLFRPIAMCLTNVHINGLARWFDNNFFYKKPVFDSPSPRLQTLFEEKYCFQNILAGFRFKAVFPEPYTMAAMSESGNTVELAYALADAMAELGKGIKGLSQMQLTAPYLVFKKPSLDEIEVSKECVRVIRNRVGCELMLHFPFGPAVNVLPHALDFKVDVLGFDMYKTRLTDLKSHGFDKVKIYLGLFDGRNTLVEKLNELKELVNRAVEFLDAREVHVGPSCELSFLPYEHAVMKVERLGLLVKEMGG